MMNTQTVDVLTKDEEREDVASLEDRALVEIGIRVSVLLLTPRCCAVLANTYLMNVVKDLREFEERNSNGECSEDLSMVWIILLSFCPSNCPLSLSLGMIKCR